MAPAPGAEGPDAVATAPAGVETSAGSRASAIPSSRAEGPGGAASARFAAPDGSGASPVPAHGPNPPDAVAAASAGLEASAGAGASAVPSSGAEGAGGAASAVSGPGAQGPDAVATDTAGAGASAGYESSAVPGAGSGPRDGVAADTDGSGGPVVSGAPVASAVPAGEPQASGGGQVRPLHEPDAYSTPPYGEPGPWAPAPPVQHPAGTPAHGVPSAVPPAPAAAGAVPPAPAAAGAVPPAPAPAQPDVVDVTPVDPWGRYDPWAVSAGVAPLQQPAGADGKPRRRSVRRAIAGGALLLALVSGGIGGIVGAYLERNGGIGTVTLPQAEKEDAARDPGSVAGIAAQALPSVVTLHVSGAGAAGTGTGFVLDERGHILTNNHVVEPAGENGEITVTFHSGDTAQATVVGRDSGYDLAVVKVKGVRGLSPLPLGNSDNVRVGDPVVAIGAPFDLAGTVTSGIISARERPITAGGEKGDGSDVSYVDALQTDAPINPGNSGGPLLDARARVIGINSAIRSAGDGADLDGGQAGSIGLGFAIPINQGKRVAEELINNGKATHPVIGITLDMNYSGDGARVAVKGNDGGPPVSTGGPGEKAGIEPGDVITEVDGTRVHSGEELIVKTRAHRPGDRLKLTLERDGKERTVSLVLGSSDGG
ncbi:protease [Streptomyces sp. WAC 01420]|nr:protease [Streptomyces sp. WAC 01420]